MTTVSTRTRRRRAPTRRALLLVALGAGIAGCVGSEDWTGIDFSAAVPSCDYPLGGGSSAGFTYVCPASASDGGSALAAAAAAVLDGGAYSLTLSAGSDPACVLGTPEVLGVPTVAVGAAFQIAYDGDPSADASAPSITATPAVDSLVRKTDEGWMITQPGYVGFVAYQGMEIAAFTHVLAREATWISFFSSDRTGALPLGGVAMDAAATTFDAMVNVPAKILAAPVTEDGALLAGTLDCTFVSEDTQRLAVVPEGVVAEVVPLLPGDVTLTATCLGLSGTATIHVTDGTTAADAGEAEAATDAEDATDAAPPHDASTLQDVDDAANVEDSP
jgi:hypothetical protein